MNNTIKLPLFLGATCLIAAGLLSAVVAITDPIIEAQKIEKENAAYQALYEGEEISTEAITFEGANENIIDIKKVTHNSKISAVYKMKSTSSYETLTFLVGISFDSKTVDSYACVDTSTASLGYGNFKKDDKVSSLYDGYDGNGTPIIAGTTVTSKAVKASMDIALKDFNARNWEE